MAMTGWTTAQEEAKVNLNKSNRHHLPLGLRTVETTYTCRHSQVNSRRLVGEMSTMLVCKS